MRTDGSSVAQPPPGGLPPSPSRLVQQMPVTFRVHLEVQTPGALPTPDCLLEQLQRETDDSREQRRIIIPIEKRRADGGENQLLAGLGSTGY